MDVDQLTRQEQLLQEAEALFAPVREDPDDLEALQRLVDWVQQSEEHSAIYQASAMGWVEELVDLAESAPAVDPGRRSTRH